MPDTASDIKNEEELARILWLATYSQNHVIYEAARNLARECEKKEIPILGGTLTIQGLLFRDRQNRSIISENSIKKGNERRDNFISYLISGIEEAPQEMWPDILKYTQKWFIEPERDAFFWATTKRNNEDLEEQLQYDIQIYARIERQQKGQ